MVLNIDDTHLVAHSLKRLVAAGLAAARRIGRESHCESTLAGDEVCLAYRRVREEFLVTCVRWLTDGRPLSMLPETTLLLRTLTALYDQAGRSATAATSGPVPPPIRTKR